MFGMLWELATGLAFLGAVFTDALPAARTAFALSLAFWAVFLLMDEIALAYRFGSLMTTHMAALLVVERMSELGPTGPS